MKRASVLFTSLLLGACASAPDIADWPPRAPAIEDETVQKYVDIYAAHEPDQPRYGPDDIDALNLLSRRMLRNGPPDGDIERLRGELDEIRAAARHEQKDDSARTYSRNEINAIKRRVERRYESKHDRRMELKRYGL